VHGPVPGDVPGRVARPVVDDDDLEVLVRLLRDRPQRVVEERLAVANREQNGDE